MLSRAVAEAALGAGHQRAGERRPRNRRNVPDFITEASGKGKVESFTVIYKGKGEVEHGVVMLRTEGDRAGAGPHSRK